MSNETLPAEHGQLLWTPGAEQLNSSRLVQYQQWLSDERGVHTHGYTDLWRWSVENLEQFWLSIWDFFGIQADGANEPVLSSMQTPGAQWFPNAQLNFAEHFACLAPKHSAATRV
jgi:acetoacetyl-CoA synthetase